MPRPVEPGHEPSKLVVESSILSRGTKHKEIIYNETID